MTQQLHTKLNALLVVAAIASSVATIGCGTPSESQQIEKPVGDRRLDIVCTTSQVADAVRHIAGERAKVTVLMGPGVDPHLYQPRPSNVLQLEQADAVFYNGLHLEGRIIETLEQLAERKTVVAITAGLVADHDTRLLTPPEFEGQHDPHVWHDVGLWSDCVRYACKRLSEIDSDGASEYQENSDAYLSKLEDLDQQTREQITAIPSSRRILVTAHDAFAYFSKAYDIETVGLKGISTEDQADFAHLDEVRRLLVDRKVPAVFVESSTSPRLVMKLIEECKSAGHTVSVGEELYSDAMGPAGSGAEEYVGMIQSNVRAIVAGLSGE